METVQERPRVSQFRAGFRENPAAFVFLGLILFSILGTILSKQFDLEAVVVQNKVSALLILSGAWAVLTGFLKAATNTNKAILFGVLWVIGIGTFFELQGMNTGIVFGEYRYTDAWWPALPWGKEHFFPLLMPISWFLVVGGSVLYCVTQFGGRGYWVAIAAAVLTDMVMEPLMVNGFRYWIWAQPTDGFVAPLHNFWGWTWISAVAIVFLRMFTGRLLESRLYWVHSLPLVGFAFFLAVMGILYDQSFTAAAGSIWFILLVGLLLVHHRKFRPV